MSKTVQQATLESPDGVRVLFTLPSAYVPGAIVLTETGQLATDGAIWLEVPPDQVQFVDAPVASQTLSFEYVPQ